MPVPFPLFRADEISIEIGPRLQVRGRHPSARLGPDKDGLEPKAPRRELRASSADIGQGDAPKGRGLWLKKNGHQRMAP